MDSQKTPVHGGGFSKIGETGFEPATSSSQTTRATELRHSPITPLV